jgi:hypothetical protein
MLLEGSGFRVLKSGFYMCSRVVVLGLSRAVLGLLKNGGFRVLKSGFRCSRMVVVLGFLKRGFRVSEKRRCQEWQFRVPKSGFRVSDTLT